MRRFRIGKVTKEDINIINSRYYENSNVLLPPVSKIRCACYMNDERNTFNDVVFWSIYKQPTQRQMLQILQHHSIHVSLKQI